MLMRSWLLGLTAGLSAALGCFATLGVGAQEILKELEHGDHARPPAAGHDSMPGMKMDSASPEKPTVPTHPAGHETTNTNAAGHTSTQGGHSDGHEMHGFL